MIKTTTAIIAIIYSIDVFPKTIEYLLILKIVKMATINNANTRIVFFMFIFRENGNLFNNFDTV